MKIKTVKLKDFSLNNVSEFQPKINIKWYQDKEAKKDNETFASLIGNKTEINNQLDTLSKNIIGDRVRTLKNLPKYHKFQDRKERIY